MCQKLMMRHNQSNPLEVQCVSNEMEPSAPSCSHIMPCILGANDLTFAYNQIDMSYDGEVRIQREDRQLHILESNYNTTNDEPSFDLDPNFLLVIMMNKIKLLLISSFALLLGIIVIYVKGIHSCH